MLTAAQSIAYAEFFARLPGVLAFVSLMSFLIEYLAQRGRA